MFGINTLLGKRSASSHPVGTPTASGALPGAEDVSGPPATKLAVSPSVEERLDDLTRTVADLSSRVALVDDLHSQIAQLKLQLVEEREAKKDLKKELAAAEASMKRSDELYKRLESRVAVCEKRAPSSFAAAVGRNETESLRKEQQVITDNVTKLQQGMEQQQRQARLPNVMLFGLDDDGQRSAVQQVTACFQAAGIPEKDKVVRAVRVGNHRATGTSAPAPVKVVMQSASDASNLLRHTRALRQRFKVNMDRDITPQQAEIRRCKQGAARQLRDLGYVTFWKGDQLVYVHRTTGGRAVYTGRLPARA